MFEANKAGNYMIRSMLEDVASDAAVLHMKEDLIEDFLIAYQEALGEIGFTSGILPGWRQRPWRSERSRPFGRFVHRTLTIFPRCRGTMDDQFIMRRV